MSAPLSPPPLRQLSYGHLPAYLSNGLMGLRVRPLPSSDGIAMVGGLTGQDPTYRVEAFARAPYPLAFDVAVDGVSARTAPDAARFVEQRYDFASGELTTRIDVRHGDVTARVEVLSFCSRSQPMLAVQRVSVSVNRSCDLRISAGLDHSGVPGRLVSRDVGSVGGGDAVCDGSMLWETPGALSRCGLAYGTSWRGSPASDRSVRDERDALAPLLTAHSVRARRGSTYAVVQLAALVPSAMHPEPDRQAARLLNIGVRKGFEELRTENRKAWSRIWDSRVRIAADERWQRITDAAFFYLHTSVHPSSVFSTSLFGLAYWPNYHYYRGHVMWDLEAFAFPPLLLTGPDCARAMLEYRYARRDCALRNARMNGYAGLQFPWESGAGVGNEVTPLEGDMLGFEQHVGLSVAQAFARFVHVTGDDAFAKERAWPVLSGVADWIVSRCARTERGWELRQTLGIAEARDAPIDNSGYVNLMARVVLGEACAMAEHERGSADAWRAARDGMFVPRLGRSRVVANHDAFTARERGEVGATPEVLAAIFPGGASLPSEVERATLEFYLGRIEPYIGSPMLSAPLGVYAARLGDRSRAAELFESGYAEFVHGPFLETTEVSPVRMPDKPVASPFFANLGGYLTSLMFGLPRMEPNGGPVESWFGGTVTLPAGWESIELERVWLRGQAHRLVARHGASRAEVVAFDG